MHKIKHLLSTARLPNIPSVVCTVLCSALLLEKFYPSMHTQAWLWQHMQTALAALCMYVAGNFLNDWHDAAWDAEQRPERALPSHIFSKKTYLSIAMAGIAIAFYLLRESNILLEINAVLLALILLYTWLHKKTTQAIWIMGACRACLIALGMGAGICRVPYVAAVMMVAMMCYIAGISMLARYEVKNAASPAAKFFALLLLRMPLVCLLIFMKLVFVHMPFYQVLPFVLLFVLWLSFSMRTSYISEKVSRLLSGISFVDWLFLGWILLDKKVMHLPSPWILYLPPACVALSWLLRKFVPAT